MEYEDHPIWWDTSVRSLTFMQLNGQGRMEITKISADMYFIKVGNNCSMYKVKGKCCDRKLTLSHMNAWIDLYPLTAVSMEKDDAPTMVSPRRHLIKSK